MRGLWLHQPCPTAELQPPANSQAQPASYAPTMWRNNEYGKFVPVPGTLYMWHAGPVVNVQEMVNVQQTTSMQAAEVEGTTEHENGDDGWEMVSQDTSADDELTPAQEHSPHSDRASPILQATHTSRADYSMASWTPSPTPDMGPLARYDPHVRHAIIRHLRPRNLPSRQTTGLPLPSG